jgi:formiminotetrahydrofolate cyclodeaminase
MRSEADALTGLEFDLGNEKTFTFGLDDRYKQELVDKNARLDEYFDSYVRQDGTWDFDTLNSHRAIIDNIDAIVSSTYRQGLSDGQKNIVQNASNVAAQVPTQTASQENPLVEQMKNLIGKGANKLTFKV